METRELKINIPDGYEIDRENSTFECIKFKHKCLTYNDVINNLFKDGNKCYFIDSNGGIGNCHIYNYDSNNATSYKQLEKLLAINRLMNVAKYLNNNWKDKEKYYSSNNANEEIPIVVSLFNNEVVHFKAVELAKQAIDILGEDTIRLVLSTDY